MGEDTRTHPHPHFCSRSAGARIFRLSCSLCSLLCVVARGFELEKTSCTNRREQPAHVTAVHSDRLNIPNAPGVNMRRAHRDMPLRLDLRYCNKYKPCFTKIERKVVPTCEPIVLDNLPAVPSYLSSFLPTSASS